MSNCLSLDPCTPQVPTVVKGADQTLDVQLKTQSGFVDLTSASEIKAVLLNADGSFLEKKLSTGGIVLVSGPSGHFQIQLAASETLLLAESVAPAYSDIQVNFVIAMKTTIVNLIGVVSIVASRYPTAP